MKYLGKTPEVEISTNAYQKMMMYTAEAEKSIGWVMDILEWDNSVFVIEDVFLIPQSVNYLESTLDKKYFEELDMLEHCYNGIGYSTVNSNVVLSEQDMKRFNIITEKLLWYIGVQMNKKGEINVFFYDKRHNVLFDNLSWSYTLEEYMTSEEAKADIGKFVTKSYAASYTGSGASTYQYGSSYYNSQSQYIEQRKSYPPSELATKKPDISTLT